MNCFYELFLATNNAILMNDLFLLYINSVQLEEQKIQL